MMFKPTGPTAIIASVCLTASLAFAAEPSVSSISVHGGQRGTEVQVKFQGQRLGDVQEIHLYEPGITVTKIDTSSDKPGKKSENSFTATLKIAPDAQVGEHHLRVRTAGGWTRSLNFFVDTLPTTEEQESRNRGNSNNSLATAQKVEGNAIIEGNISNEDVDYYAVSLKKNQRLTVEVQGIRLGTSAGSPFDPTVAVVDEHKFEVARSDDSALLKQDPSLSMLAPEDGTYYIMIHDGEYGGGGNFIYRMYIGNLPRPTAIYPAGGQVGESLQAQFIGDKRGPMAATIKLPEQAAPVFAALAQDKSGYAPSPNWLRVSTFPNAMEAEPNDDAKAVTKAVPAPVALNGIISKPGDVDFFRFSAKKGEALDIQAFARAIRTPLDPTMTVHDAQGRPIASNDDSGGELDSYIRFRVPADGEYLVSVKDQLNRGGDDFVYRIEISESQPSLRFTIPEVSRRDTQTRQWVAIPRGGKATVRLMARRNNFSGPLTITCPDLPAGVTMHAPQVAENANDISVVFEASADAPIGGNLCDVIGKSADGKVTGRFIQGCDLVRGNPNGASYYAIDLPRLGVAVVEEAPFSITLGQPKVSLLQSGVMNLKVHVKRNEGYTGEVNAYLVTLPAGVSAKSRVIIPKDKDEVELPINSSKGAATGKWPMTIEAFGPAATGGSTYIAASHIVLEVAPGLMDGKIELGTAEAGKPATVNVHLQQKNAFEGKAKVELMGLPAKCVAEPVFVTKDDSVATFTVQTDATSPVGQHRSLAVQVSLEKNGEQMIQTFGLGGAIRIDRPGTASAEKKPAVTAKPAEKKSK